MASEVWQFLIVVIGFFVVALIWLFVVYLPGRTMESWEDQPHGRGEGKTTFPVDSSGSDELSTPGS